MSKLHVYTVHINPSLSEPYEAAEFIEEGFSWKAFIFSGLWCLYHRLWWPAVVIFAFNALMLFLLDDKALTHGGFTIVNLGVHLFIGFAANDWRRTRLKNLGYITADIVTSDSLLRAEQRFFDRYFSNRTSAPFIA